MNVLLLTDKLEMGGAEIYFCKLENRLHHENMSFFTAAGGGELYRSIEKKERFQLLSRKNHAMNLMRLRNMIKKHNIHLVHANSLRMVLYAILLKKTMRQFFRIYYTKHNVTIAENRYSTYFANLLNKYVNRIITVSEFEKENLLTFGLNPRRITTIYNGVDLEQFTYSQKSHNGSTFKVGILARLSEEKNHAFFLEVAQRLRNVPGISFYIGGDGPDYDKLARKITEFDIESTVKMIGAVKEPQHFIREMDVLLLTSNREVFPMVIIEAMAVGTPVISINKGGIKEAVNDRETGYLISSHSAEEFCEKILLLQGNEVIRRRLVNQARMKAVTEFSLDSMVKRTLESYMTI
ncbi:glycosyltransferase family 4 protein [Fictibacillus aquaticus]|uniref:Glycosyltransferase n=1 Tax=Fictibacillus aquaticus TaxID=2021314 RepID=A0A235F8N8_9BACL|nr:glycosyltransferase family 4 protein [Fictibacillus aquaticus]OYD57721.1 glycosyltransferase [Fictibacillus aquaticus]